MDISHKYPYTNFEQLNIDFLLETVADHSNKITQLRTDLQTEIDTRIADVEVLTAEDANLTAFANQIQSDLNQEIADRAAAVSAEAAAREAAIAAEAATRAGDVEILTEEDANLTAFANQIQADLNQEIADRAAAVAAEADARIAEDDALTAFANQIQADLTQEISDREAADEAVAPVLFHLSYGQGGVLDCLPDEANDIMKAFDENRRAMVQFPSGHWYERINVFNTTGAQFAYFALINYPSVITAVSGNIIELKHLDHDDTHTFNSRSFSVDTAPNVIHITSSSNVPDVSATFTTTDDLWDVIFMDKDTYIELTCPGTTPTRFYTRSKSVINESLPGSYSAEYVFSYWDLDTRYDIDIVLSKPDETDPSTWTATMTGRKKTYETVS